MAKAKRMIKNESKRNNNKKKFHLGKLILVVAIVLTVFLVVETKINDDSIKGDIQDNKTFENLSIQNIDVKYEDGNCFFKMKLLNESDTEFQGRDIIIVFKNKDKSTYANIEYHIDNIKSQEAFYINTSTNIDLTKAKDFYVENKN